MISLNSLVIFKLFTCSDPGFLKQYPAFGADDLMQWQIETKETIVPEKCSFRLKPANLELKLIKTVISKWESLEATAGKFIKFCLAGNLDV